MERRIRSRARDDPRQNDLRLDLAKRELAEKPRYEYVINNNDDLQHAVDHLIRLITEVRKKIVSFNL